MKTMASLRALSASYGRNLSSSRSIFCHYHGLHSNPLQSQSRSISSTTHLRDSWMDKIKGVFTGKKTSPQEAKFAADSFTLLRFADELKNARRLGTFKKYMVGRSSEATFADAFEKQEAIIRYLGGFDPTGENLQTNQKQEAAKCCNCTIADVENALSKFTWAKEAQRKIEKLKEEGKPLPKSMAEVQKLVESTPLDLARSNLAKSGQISRNALCPCGSKNRYKSSNTGVVERIEEIQSGPEIVINPSIEDVTQRSFTPVLILDEAGCSRLSKDSLLFSSREMFFAGGRSVARGES